MKHSGMVISTF
jgi:hypothetical protein